MALVVEFVALRMRLHAICALNLDFADIEIDSQAMLQCLRVDDEGKQVADALAAHAKDTAARLHAGSMVHLHQPRHHGILKNYIV
ncbi:hypothetical protein FRX31_033855 [Thalictrum thalictroides]|uniref:Uncharacterized protein n=1 Tax=Thalictrum thalictroides TaxID=46969 RepID=A0A7J6UVE6_THATH|nr:hypothetical protein FRX31_033855 [Thalictrum thalictroides]